MDTLQTGKGEQKRAASKCGQIHPGQVPRAQLYLPWILRRGERHPMDQTSDIENNSRGIILTTHQQLGVLLCYTVAPPWTI